jgi:hypothetical protein
MNFGPLRNIRHLCRSETLIFKNSATCFSVSIPGCLGREGGLTVGGLLTVESTGGFAVGWRFRCSNSTMRRLRRSISLNAIRCTSRKSSMTLAWLLSMPTHFTFLCGPVGAAITLAGHATSTLDWPVPRVLAYRGEPLSPQSVGMGSAALADRLECASWACAERPGCIPMCTPMVSGPSISNGLRGSLY